jgi:large subunit ribosomal protein L35
MPKTKTHSGASKRMKKLKSGKIKYTKAGRRHLLTKKSAKRKRNLRSSAYLSGREAGNIAALLRTN